MDHAESLDGNQDAIRHLARELNTLHRQTAAECETLVNSLIESGSRDIAQIEQLLDQTLDACAHDSVLPSYKKLCRYYATIDLTGATFYANAYLEMWGED